MVGLLIEIIPQPANSDSRRCIEIRETRLFNVFQKPPAEDLPKKRIPDSLQEKRC